MVVRPVVYLLGLKADLPRGVYILQGGLVLNAFGNGAAAPFLVLYLHDVRGLPLGLAGLASATGASAALLSALVAGAVADRRGSRPTMIAGLLCSAASYALYPLIRESWQAFPIAVLAGAGIGTWLTMQSSLLAAITPPQLRAPAFAQQRVAANIGLGLGGFAGGLIVTTTRPSTFTTLFVLNAATFLVYTLFLMRVPVPASARVERPARGYRDVVRDRAFMRFAALNLLFVVTTISLLNSLFPVFAKNQGHVSERTIGAFFLLNSVLIIVFQLPTTRASEGRSRMRGFALTGVLFGLCWLLVFAGGETNGGVIAVVLLGAGIALMSFGECLYDSVQGPLVSDLAPAQLVGRYMAVIGFSWQFGFILGPAAGGFILGAEPRVLWPLMACICGLGALYALRLERRLPEAVRFTPRRCRPSDAVTAVPSSP
jgi:MFS family permease